jgi:hypothetical protein
MGVIYEVVHTVYHLRSLTITFLVIVPGYSVYMHVIVASPHGVDVWLYVMGHGDSSADCLTSIRFYLWLL